MSTSVAGLLKLTCAAVSLSWIGSQGLLIYHLNYGKSNVATEHISSAPIALSARDSRKGLVDAVLRLYRLEFNKEKMNFFEVNATFEDPAVSLNGRDAIASGFSKMAYLFKASESLSTDIIHSKDVVAIDQIQRYTLPGDISLDLPSVIYLYLKGEPGNEKIARVVEEWYSKPIIGKDSPYSANIGFIASQFRKAHGLPFKYF